MKISNFLGIHRYVKGSIIIKGVSYTLQIAPNHSTNPKAPKYQLVFKQVNHPAHDIRLSGLFEITGKVLCYKGDILRNGKKQPFTICLDKVQHLATIQA